MQLSILRKLLGSIGGRSFAFTMLCLAIASVFCWYGKMSGEAYAALIGSLAFIVAGRSVAADVAAPTPTLQYPVSYPNPPLIPVSSDDRPNNA